MGKNRSEFFFCCLIAIGFIAMGSPMRAQDGFKAVAFYHSGKERQNLQFTATAIDFLNTLASRDHFRLDTSSDWNNLNEAFLKNYQLLIWLNDPPRDPQQRKAFEQYMKKGGAWLGFHDAGYNDQKTGWPWFTDFMGGAVFRAKNIPALTARLLVTDSNHPITRRVPPAFSSPPNEWYQWKPDPGTNSHVQVLVSLDSGNYPLGMKSILSSGETAVVWTNTRYRMLYINMGYGEKTFSDFLQNHLIEDGLLWLTRKK